jgi:midasin
LRNRFTEIWVPPINDFEGIASIIQHNLAQLESSQEKITAKIISFIEWFSEMLHKSFDTIISIRDILAWAAFIKASLSKEIMSLEQSFIHGGCLVFIDGIGVNPLFGISSSDKGALELRQESLKKLVSLAGFSDPLEEFTILSLLDYKASSTLLTELVSSKLHFGIPPFILECGNEPVSIPDFAVNAPTTSRNLLRVLRALEIQKPILLEGSPGVGKTSLISTIASLSGNRLCRINLSDQTDLMDLFGSDLPVEGGSAGEFEWRDGPFLSAMKTGEWVLLDELNLANQQVLEGLNACLDHRSSVYIPELDKTFITHPKFRVFAAQNPYSQGGGRKGLPRSFVNRFTQVTN